MQFNAHLNKHRPQNDFTPLLPYAAALKLFFSKPLGHNHFLVSQYRNCFIACAVADLQAHKLTSVPKLLAFSRQHLCDIIVQQFVTQM